MAFSALALQAVAVMPAAAGPTATPNKKELVWAETKAVILDKCANLATTVLPAYSKAVHAIAAAEKLDKQVAASAVEKQKSILEATSGLVVSVVTQANFDFSQPETSNSPEVDEVLTALGDMAVYCKNMSAEAPAVYGTVAAWAANPKKFAAFAAPQEIEVKVQKMVEAVVSSSQTGAYPAHRKQMEMVK